MGCLWGGGIKLRAGLFRIRPMGCSIWRKSSRVVRSVQVRGYLRKKKQKKTLLSLLSTPSRKPCGRLFVLFNSWARREASLRPSHSTPLRLFCLSLSISRSRRKKQGQVTSGACIRSNRHVRGERHLFAAPLLDSTAANATTWVSKITAGKLWTWPSSAISEKSSRRRHYKRGGGWGGARGGWWWV